MPSLNTPEEIREHYKHLNINETMFKGIAFRIVDLFLNNITQEAIDCGAYYMPGHVGDEKLEKAFGEILWALYEQHFEKKAPEVAGPWVNIGLDGIHLSKERFPEFDIVQTSMGGMPVYKKESNDSVE